MKVVDASSIIKAWDIYPFTQFPKVWDWLEKEFKSKELVMVEPNYEEVGHASPDLQHWLSDKLTRLPVTNEIVGAALSINGALDVTNNAYHPKGVDENDVFCIAAAGELRGQAL